MNFWGFLLAYLGAAAVIAGIIAGLGILLPDEEAPYRLGHSVWICTECHGLYRHKITHCPAGHIVIEAVRQGVGPPWQTYAGGYDPYATEILLEAIASEH